MEVRYYTKEDGTAPFLVWLDNLKDAQAVIRIRKRILRIMEGNFG